MSSSSPVCRQKVILHAISHLAKFSPAVANSLCMVLFVNLCDRRLACWHCIIVALPHVTVGSTPSSSVAGKQTSIRVHTLQFVGEKNRTILPRLLCLYHFAASDHNQVSLLWLHWANELEHEANGSVRGWPEGECWERWMKHPCHAGVSTWLESLWEKTGETRGWKEQDRWAYWTIGSAGAGFHFIGRLRDCISLNRNVSGVQVLSVSYNILMFLFWRQTHRKKCITYKLVLENLFPMLPNRFEIQLNCNTGWNVVVFDV